MHLNCLIFCYRCQFPSYRRQISDQKAKRNVTAKCSITENVQNVKSLHLYQKTSRRSEEIKVKKKCIFCTTREFICLNFSPIFALTPILSVFFPPLELRCFPLFCFLYYSLIFTVFNSIIPTLNCEIFPELMDSQELEDNRPCNLNSSLKKL